MPERRTQNHDPFAKFPIVLTANLGWCKIMTFSCYLLDKRQIGASDAWIANDFMIDVVYIFATVTLPIDPRLPILIGSEILHQETVQRLKRYQNWCICLITDWQADRLTLTHPRLLNFAWSTTELFLRRNPAMPVRSRKIVSKRLPHDERNN